MSVRKRIEFIDLAKGVCILLVVLMHCTGFNDPYGLLKNLRMPLYFFLSGIFFKDYGGFKPTLLKKTDRLLVPAIFFLAIYLLCSVIAHAAAGKNVADAFEVIHTDDLRIFTPVWFLICLFWQCMIFLTICRLTSSMLWRGILVITCGGIGLVCSRMDIVIYNHIDTALTALPFFYCGCIYRHANMLDAKRFEAATLCRIVALIALAAWLAKVNRFGTIHYQTNVFTGNPILCYAESLALILALLDICRAVRYIPFVSYCGEFSIIILGVHLIFVLFIDHLEQYLHKDFPGALIFLTVIIISALLIEPFRKFFPKFTAQQDLFSAKKGKEKSRSHADHKSSQNNSEK